LPPSQGGRPEWYPEGEIYWATRQAKLITPTFGDQLTRSEVIVMENLEALGELAEWTPKTHSAKTSDFYWLSRDGKPWDIKTPSLEGWSDMTAKQQYKRIGGRLSDDAPFKKNILVDLGDQDLTGNLRRELELYNIRRQQKSEYQIHQLVVLSHGRFHTVTLA